MSLSAVMLRAEMPDICDGLLARCSGVEEMELQYSSGVSTLLAGVSGHEPTVMVGCCGVDNLSGISLVWGVCRTGVGTKTGGGVAEDEQLTRFITGLAPVQ